MEDFGRRSLLRLAGAGALGPAVVEAAESPGGRSTGELNVVDFGAAPDGRKDCTKSFQTALDRAGNNGAVVRVPVGQYRIDGNLSIPPGVTLEGTWRGMHYPDPAKGSTLFAFAGRDKEEAEPLVKLASNSTLKGLSVYYPEQKASNIRPYPWCVSVRGDRASVLDLAVANAYNGIDCGTHTNAAHMLRNVNITALRRGVFVDRCYDIGRLENIHVHPTDWAVLGKNCGMDDWGALKKFQLNNLEGFIIGKCDWSYMVDCFVIFAKTGFRFVEMSLEPGKPLGQAAQGNILITQSGSDLSPVAVLIEKVQDHSGIAFENCQFMNSVEIEPTNRGPLKLTNCGFWGQCRTGSVLVNKGKGEVLLTACHFSAWEDENNPYQWDPKIPFIDAQNGALLMTACVFKDYGHTPHHHIRLGPAVDAAVIQGNMVQGGKLKIDNQSKGDVQIIGNVRAS